MVLTQLLTAGFVVGAGWRVVTAGGIGANIRGGIAIMFGGPGVAALLGGALVQSVILLNRA